MATNDQLGKHMKLGQIADDEDDVDGDKENDEQSESDSNVPLLGGDQKIDGDEIDGTGKIIEMQNIDNIYHDNQDEADKSEEEPNNEQEEEKKTQQQTNQKEMIAISDKQNEDEQQTFDLYEDGNNDEKEMEAKYDTNFDGQETNIYLSPYEGYMIKSVHGTPLTHITHHIPPKNGYPIKQLYKSGSSTFGLNIAITPNDGNRFYYEIKGHAYCGYAKSTADTTTFCENTSIFAWNGTTKSFGNDKENPYPAPTKQENAVESKQNEQKIEENESESDENKRLETEKNDSKENELKSDENEPTKTENKQKMEQNKLESEQIEQPETEENDSKENKPKTEENEIKSENNEHPEMKEKKETEENKTDEEEKKETVKEEKNIQQPTGIVIEQHETEENDSKENKQKTEENDSGEKEPKTEGNEIKSENNEHPEMEEKKETEENETDEEEKKEIVKEEENIQQPTGPVIGCLLDFEKGTISYYRNGNDLGAAFEGIHLSEKEHIYPIFMGYDFAIKYKREDMVYLPNDCNCIEVEDLLKKTVEITRSQKKTLISEPLRLSKTMLNKLSLRLTGKWAFEVEYKFNNIARDFEVGWVSSNPLKQKTVGNIGDDKNSWSINPLTSIKRTSNKSYLTVIPVSGAQTIECFVDIEEGQISYRKCRDIERIAFNNIDFKSGIIYPAISFHSGAAPIISYNKVTLDKLAEGYQSIESAPWYSYGMYHDKTKNQKSITKVNYKDVLLKNFSFSNITKVYEGWLVGTNMGYFSVLSRTIFKTKLYFEAKILGNICKDFTINLLLETFVTKDKEIKMICSVDEAKIVKNDVLQILIDTESQNAMIMIKLNGKECAKCVQINPFIEINLSSIYISISASLQKEQQILFLFDPDVFEYELPDEYNILSESTQQDTNKLSELVFNALQSNTKSEIIQLYLKIMSERIMNISADVTLLQQSLMLIEKNCENNILSDLIKFCVQEWSIGDTLERREQSQYPIDQQLQRMIQSFISKSTNPLSSAVQMARFIYKYSNYFPDIKDELNSLGEMCEKQAIHIMQSMQSNRLKIIYVEADNTLSLAINHELKEFVSSNCLQTLRYAIWISDPVKLLCKPDIDLMAKAEGELITWIKILFRDYFQNITDFSDFKHIYGSLRLQHQYFYSPIGRMQMEFFVYLAFLLLIFAVSISVRSVWTDHVEMIEYIVWAANASFTFSEIMQMFSTKHYWKDANNYLDLIICAMMLTIFILRTLVITEYVVCEEEVECDSIECECDNKPLNVLYINVWFILILSGCARLIYLSFVFQSMGLLINNIIQITLKLLNLIAFTAILTFGFGIAIYVAVGDELLDYSSPTTSARTIVFGLVETLDWNVFTQISGENNFGYFRSTSVQFWIFIFVIFSAVILLNLIIAIMTTTYEEVNSNAVEDVNFHRFLVCYQKSNELAVLPPPFQFIVALISYLIQYALKICGKPLDVSWTICYEHEHYKDYKERVKTEQLKQKRRYMDYIMNESQKSTLLKQVVVAETSDTQKQGEEAETSNEDNDIKMPDNNKWICNYCCATNFDILTNYDFENMNRQTQGFSFVKSDLEILASSSPTLCANCYRNKRSAKIEHVLASSISFYLYAIIAWICRIPFCILLIIYLMINKCCKIKSFSKADSWIARIDPSNNMGYDLKLTNPKAIEKKDIDIIANGNGTLKQKLIQCQKTNESIIVLKNVPYDVANSFEIIKERINPKDDKKEYFNYIADTKPKIILHGRDIDFDFDGNGVTTAYQKRK